MLLGVIADTHGYLAPSVARLFARVDHILHAGDIGPSRLLRELETIAPVTAVLGNNDAGLVYREAECVELDGQRLFLQHIVDPERPGPALERRWQRDPPAVVVFGHTHRSYAQTHGTIFFLNPGYAGKPRFDLPRSVALLQFRAGTPQVTFLPLTD